MRVVRRLGLVLAALALFALVPVAAAAGPTVTYSITAGTAGDGGWYRSDVTAQIMVSGATDTSCPSVRTFRSSSEALDCTATDGPSTVTFHLQFRIDKDAPQVTGAAPSRPPNANGWYNAPVTVAFSGSDATSGIASCSQSTYSGPDRSGASVTGTCRDQAGNVSAASSHALSFDATPPAVTAAVGRAPDANGWYNHAVAVSFSGVDATSGDVGCDAAKTYNSPETGGTTVSGRCTDAAGNSGTGGLSLKYDSTSPAVTASPGRGPDRNGWYNHGVAVSFSGSDALSGVASCDAAKTYSGPGSATANVSGACTDAAGNRGTGAATLAYDAAPPETKASPARAADANGWYNHSVAVAFTGIDAVSGGVSCDAAKTYSGPDSSGTNVGGACTDKAGNTGSDTVLLKYDATPPSLRALAASAGDKRVQLSWTASPDATSVAISRAPARGGAGTARFAGKAKTFTDTGLANGQRYRYNVVVRDDAGNEATGSVLATPLALYRPAAGAQVRPPVVLEWGTRPQARYYNVQLFRRGKVLSLWPRANRVRLPVRWTYGGKRYRLEPGLYRWYVWPGVGDRKDARYGPRIGSSEFTVAA